VAILEKDFQDSHTYYPRLTFTILHTSLRIIDFWWGRKTRESREKPENPEKNPCGMRENNIRNISQQLIQELNLVHRGERQVLSPLGHPCRLWSIQHVTNLMVYLLGISDIEFNKSCIHVKPTFSACWSETPVNITRGMECLRSLSDGVTAT